MRKRFGQHKRDSVREKFSHRKVYSYFNSIGWENVKVILIDEYNLQNKLQLLREEDKVIQLYLQNDKCLNVLRPYFGLERKDQRKVYKEMIKEHIKKESKNYYIKNQAEILEYRKQYREKNKEKVSDCKKQWYQKNKGQMKENVQNEN